MATSDSKAKDKGGRPPRFKDSEELKNKIEEYFKKGLKKRIVLIGRPPNQQTVEIPVPTITGLALYLGFESRQSFYDYEKEKEFSYTIKKARTLIEQEYEEQLQHGSTIGAIFALKNMGWIDKVESEQTNINYNTELSKEEAKALKNDLENEY